MESHERNAAAYPEDEEREREHPFCQRPDNPDRRGCLSHRARAQQIAEEAGAERVLLASTVDDARAALAREARIDVCVLDLKLGEEDATQLIEHFSGLGVAVLVATAFDSAAPNIDAPLLIKPYQEAELLEAIHAVIRNRR